MSSLPETYGKEVNGIVKKSAQLLRSKYGLWVLGAISFIDSALAFPGPIDPFLAAYIVANRTRVWTAFIVSVASSVLGGVMLYIFAAYFTDQLLSLLSPESFLLFSQMVATFDQGTFMLSFLGAFTPIPYGIVAVAAGVLKGSLLMFIIGSSLGRALRFGAVAYVTYRFGERALELANKHLAVASVFSILLVFVYFVYIYAF